MADDEVTAYPNGIDVSGNAPSVGLTEAIPRMAPESNAQYRPTFIQMDNTPVQSYREHAYDFAKFALPSVAVGMFDTFGTSLGLIDDNKMGQLLSDVIPAWGDYYQRNKEPIRTVADLTGMFIPGMLGVKAVQSTAKLRSVVEDAGFAGKLIGSLLHSGKTSDELLSTFQAGVNELASAGTINFSKIDPTIQSLKRSTMLTSLGDKVKEAVGFEVATAATMNSSDTLYPPDQSLSSYLLWNAGLGAIPVGGEFLFTKRAMGKAIAKSAEISERILNPAGVDFGSLNFLPGQRDLGITALARSKQAQKGLQQESAGNSQLVENLNSAILAGDDIIKTQLGKMAQDNPFKRYSQVALTSKFELNGEQLNTARNMLDNDATSLLGTLSFEQPFYSVNDINEFYKNKKSYIDKLNDDINKIQKAAADPDLDLNQKLTKLGESIPLVNEKNVLQGSQEFVLERTGEQTPLMFRKPRFTDGNWGIKIETKRANQYEPATYYIKGITDDFYQGEEGVGVTGDFHVLLPKVEPATTVVQTTTKVLPSNVNGPLTINVPVPVPGQAQTVQVMRTNIKQVVKPQDLSLPENQRLLLRNLGAVFHWETGQLGKPIADQLPSELRSALRQWTGSSNAGPLREWEKAGDPRFQQLYNAFGTMRQQLRELAGPDGTIPLWRGERVSETKNPINNLVSMTTDYNVAKGFASGGNITRVWVPVDDIVASAGFKGEHEFIVKNALQRRVGTAPSELGSSQQVMHVPVTLSVEQLNKLLPAQQEQVTKTITQNIAAAAPVSNYEALDYKGRSAAFALMQTALDKYNPETAGPLFFHAGEHWTRLDAANSLIAKNGFDVMAGKPLGATSAKLNFPQAWGTAEQLVDNINHATLVGKYQSFKLLMDLKQQAADGLIKLAKNQELNHYDFQYLLNLPADVNGEISPWLKLFNSMYAQGTEDFKLALPDMDSARRAIQEFTDLDSGQISKFKNTAPPVFGNNLAVPDKTAPIMAVKKNLASRAYTDQAIEEAMAAQKGLADHYLATAKNYGAELVQMITDAVNNSAVSLEARQTQNLIEGSLPGRQIANMGNWNARGNSTLEAANRLINMIDTMVKNWIGKAYEKHVPIFNQLRAANNEGHLIAFNMFEQSRRYGWDLTGAVKETKNVQINGEPFYGFVMDPKSTYNKTLWKRIFGDEIPFPEGDEPLMPAMTSNKFGQPLYVSPMAKQAIDSFAELGDIAYQNTNHIRRTLGLHELNHKNFWMPPRNLARENVGYITRPDGTKTVLSGATPAELERVRVAEEKRLTDMGLVAGQDFWYNKQEQLAEYFDLHDEPFFNLQNFADGLLQTGKSRGSLGRQTLERGPGVLNDMITVLNNQLFSIAHRAQALNFNAEIQHARLMHQMSGFTNRFGNPSIWQTYIRTIYGAHPNDRTNMLSRGYSNIEDFYNGVMDTLFDKVRAAGGVNLNPTANAIEFARNHEKEYAAIKQQLQGYSPFKDTADFIDQTFKTSVPPTMRQHMGKFNNFISTIVLRFLETGNAVLNGLSFIANTPAVIRSLTRMDGESETDWVNRIGLYATPVSDEIAAFNPARIMTSTIHDLFNNKEFKEGLQRAASKGFFDQQVAELQRTLTAPQEGYLQSLIRKGIDKASYISDKSEQLTRMHAFAVGYKMAKDLFKVENETDQFLFANNIADQIIGNYRSANRPAMFSGAAGMPLGLFQTFTWNYMHRIFSYIENKQFRALATQYAMQAAVFGARTVPGFDQFNNYIFSANDGQNNPVDALRNRFGDGVADVILYGTVSNIPRLFANDGISVYTRGDANVKRIPGIWNLSETPLANLALNTYQILSQTVDNFQQAGGFSKHRMAEILGTYLMNRPIRNLFQMAAGDSVDRSGELISDDVNNGLSIAARVIGMRPLSESKQVEALSRMTAIQKAQEYEISKLRMQTRAAIRGNTFDAPTVTDAVRDYVSHGGSVSGFSRWLRDQFLAADVTKGQRQLLDTLHDTSQDGLYNTMRLLHSGVADPDN